MNQRKKISPVKSVSLAVAGVLAMEGCSTLPDMRLAKQAKVVGDYATAEAHYKTLADDGYYDAAIYLGDTYLQQGGPDSDRLAAMRYRDAMQKGDRKQRDYARLRLAKLLANKSGATEAELREANELFRQAYDSGDEAVLPLLVKLHMAHQHLWPQEETLAIIRDARQRGLPEANLAQLVMYKQTPDVTPHLAEMAALCEQVLEQVVGCYPELAEIYHLTNNSDSLESLFEKATAEYQAERLKPSILYRMANILIKSEFSEIRPDMADDTYQLIEDEYPKALIARIRLRLDHPHLSNEKEVLALLDRARQLQLPEAELLTGKLYYDGKLAPKDPAAAEQHLLKVSGQFSHADFWLGQIYLNGYLGRPDLQKAQKHLLLAARAGSNRADYALAEMYRNGKGVKPNPTYVYLFAKLAAEADPEKAATLLSDSKNAVTPAEMRTADGLMVEEQQFRARIADTVPVFDTPAVDSQSFEPVPGNFPEYEWGVSTQVAYRWDDDQYLGIAPGGKTDELQINIKPWIKAELNESWRFFTQLQGFAATDVTDIDSDQGGGSSDGFIGVRELWFDYKGVTSFPGETLRIGRQRVREEDGLWWDTNIESVRWIFDTTTLFAFAGVAQEFYHYRTDENQLGESEKNQLNLFTTVSWQWQPGHHVGSRLLFKDHGADKVAQGTAVSQSDTNELARGNFYWFALNTKSNYFNYRSEETFNYYAELAWLHFDGDNALLTTNNNGVSTVTGYQSETADNLALDLGIRWKLPVASRAHLGAAMAIGTGGSEGGASNSFVQTGLQSNRSRFTGTRASFHRFNEAYRAELTNLQVATLYGTLADPSEFDFSVVYQYFQRNDGNESIVADGVSAPLVNNSKDLGHGLDLVGSYYFREILPLVNWRFERDAYARLRASTFKPGDAYGSGVDSLKYRVTMDVSFQF